MLRETLTFYLWVTSRTLCAGRGLSFSELAVDKGKGERGDGIKHTDDGLWVDEMVSICMVEVCDTFTRKLQVLLLVMADGHMSCP